MFQSTSRARPSGHFPNPYPALSAKVHAEFRSARGTTLVVTSDCDCPFDARLSFWRSDRTRSTTPKAFWLKFINYTTNFGDVEKTHVLHGPVRGPLARTRSEHPSMLNIYPVPATRPYAIGSFIEAGSANVPKIP